VHVALARKYRPRAFGELIGQEHVARALRGAVEQNRVAHGYLLSGPRGVGKTTAARILAMALNCETRHAGGAVPAPGEPCGRCPSCERIWSGGASLDVVEIDAASNRGVDDARDLRERAMYAASRAERHKVYIVDEAHMLTREAWNTLLKVLEEPPPGVVFVFATTEPHKITNTAAPVMSRLQRFDFRRVGPHAIAARLTDVARAERLTIEPDAVALIARVADGGLRDALSILDQVVAFGEGAASAARVREVLGLVGDEAFAELFRLVLDRDAAAVFPFVARLAEAGVDLVAFAEGAADLWRAALAVRLGAEPEGISTALAQTVRERVQERAPGDYLRMLRALEEVEEAVARGAASRLSFELLLVRWAMLDRTVEIAQLLDGLPAGTAGAPTPPPPRTRSSSAPSNPSGSPARLRDAAATRASRAAAPPPSPDASAAAPDPDVQHAASGPLERDAVAAAWPRVLDALRADRRMLAATALETVTIADVAGDVIVLEAGEGDAIMTEGLARHRSAVQSAASRVLGRPVRIATVQEASAASEAVPTPSPPPGAVPGSAARPQRISVSGAKAERARALRGKDPALDGAMDALDLELLE
jgi:DNA polymerase-3 subunit gamma/tau